MFQRSSEILLLLFLKPSFGQGKIIAKIAKEKSKGVDGIRSFDVCC